MGSLRFNNFIHSVADAGRVLLRGRLLSSDDQEKSIAKLCHELLSTLGEASGTALARDIADSYMVMDAENRLAFFETLKNEFDVDHEAVLAIADEFRKSRDEASLISLAAKVEPKRQELFRRVNMAPNGTATIVRMRRDLLKLIKEHPHLAAVDADMKHLLSSWFNRGFLILEKINWETPAIILEKLIEYETVHEMKGWDDLRRRLADDRRCFAFFHRALPNEPLIFVEVALVEGLSGSIDPIIDHERPITNPTQADTAIFYSINNCLEGLHGISFGNFLIKQVVQELSQEFPGLTRFSTLSPIPGFRKWLNTVKENRVQYGITDEERQLLLNMDRESWYENVEISDALQPVLMKLAVYYFIKAKKGNKPLDPVARFHLRNGARLERINWHGDCSPNGIMQSAGMLVNYVYSPDSIVRNHESYVKNNTLTISNDVLNLLSRALRAV
jgi:malonyl-CoA decarboxylase